MKYYPKTTISIILMVVIIMIVAIFANSCGNHSIGIGEYEWNHLHYSLHNGESGCFNIEKWYESGTGIEVETHEAGYVFFSEGTYILISDEKDCPFCNKNYY